MLQDVLQLLHPAVLLLEILTWTVRLHFHQASPKVLDMKDIQSARQKSNHFYYKYTMKLFQFMRILLLNY